MKDEDTNQNTLKRWLDPKELYEEFGFKPNNQSQMRMKKRIPYSKVCGYIRYDRYKINKWLEDNEIKVGELFGYTTPSTSKGKNND